jgi:hypothetical protein
MDPEIVFAPSAFKHRITEMPYTDLTDEEYDALDEELSRTVPAFGPPGSDWLVQRGQTPPAGDSPRDRAPRRDLTAD